MPAPIQAALQDAAVLSSYYTVIAEGHNARLFAARDQPPADAAAGRETLTDLAPDVSGRYPRAADQPRDYLAPAVVSPAPAAAAGT